MEKLGSRRPKYLGYTVTACAPGAMYCGIDGGAVGWTVPLMQFSCPPGGENSAERGDVPYAVHTFSPAPGEASGWLPPPVPSRTLA